MENLIEIQDTTFSIQNTLILELLVDAMQQLEKYVVLPMEKILMMETNLQCNLWVMSREPSAMSKPQKV